MNKLKLLMKLTTFLKKPKELKKYYFFSFSVYTFQASNKKNAEEEKSGVLFGAGDLDLEGLLKPEYMQLNQYDNMKVIAETIFN